LNKAIFQEKYMPIYFDEGVCFISKPFSKKDLAIKIREALDR
jgi:hypothetical protein